MKKTTLALALALALPVYAGDDPVLEVDQVAVDNAIRRGVEYLKTRNAEHLKPATFSAHTMRWCELVLWTYVHAGVPVEDPAFQELLTFMLDQPLEHTYTVSLQALILEEIDRVGYQSRIWKCAKFLADNQNVNGQWGYGSPTPFTDDAPTATVSRPGVSTGGAMPKQKVLAFMAPGARVKPVVKLRMLVKKDRDGEGHDNSNSQYAALAMRACYDAGMIFPPAVIDKAIDWCRKTQKPTEGPAIRLDMKGDDVPVGGGTIATESYAAEPAGWCYGDHADHRPYGSMSAGMTGSLAIYLYIKDDDWQKQGGKTKRTWRHDPDVLQGMAWMTKNFSISTHPGLCEHGMTENTKDGIFYYYMYALERAGMLYGTEWLGSHKWYPEGARYLIGDQDPNGAWRVGGGEYPGDTCFAILFLNRATRPLSVATTAGVR